MPVGSEMSRPVGADSCATGLADATTSTDAGPDGGPNSDAEACGCGGTGALAGAGEGLHPRIAIVSAAPRMEQSYPRRRCAGCR